MYVIRAQNSAAEGVPAATGTTFNIFPADRCTWQQTYNSTGKYYSISNARFFGNGTTAVTLTSAELGYIGKTGRFVPITD